MTIKKYKITENNITYDVEEYSSGNKYWYINGKYHRENGPAIESKNGDKWWYVNDELHRENGPAVEHYDGSKEWYKNDKSHRYDGPAKEWAAGSVEYWYNGNYLYNINSDKELKRYIKLISIS